MSQVQVKTVGGEMKYVIGWVMSPVFSFMCVGINIATALNLIREDSWWFALFVILAVWMYAAGMRGMHVIVDHAVKIGAVGVT